MNHYTVKASELNLGDTVELFEGPFSFAIVKKISHDLVWFYRPYATTANDVAYAGNQLICLMGVEEFAVSRQGSTTYKVWQSMTTR